MKAGVQPEPPTLIDLFAGCGGMTAGFAAAGFEPRLAVEWDLQAAATYAENFGEDHVICDDIANVDDARVPQVDLVIGGPPCQGFSNLGARDPGDARNRLWRQYARVVAAARPSIFVIENVDRFATSPEFALLEDEVERGCLSDYELVVDVLNAANYGVPQRRRRTIVICSRIGTPTLPLPTHAERPTTDGQEPWRTVRAAFDGVPFWPETTRLADSTVEHFEQSVPGPFKGLDLHLGRNPTEKSLRRYDAVPPGGSRFDIPDELLPDCWRNKLTGTLDVMGRMRWDAPSLTIRTEFFKPEKGQYLHPQYDHGCRVNRPITHIEAARLQSFPPDFIWCGTKIEIAKQIGNAVPPRLAEAVARQVLGMLDPQACLPRASSPTSSVTA